VATATVVIVVDLSDPGSVLPSAQQWLSLVSSKLAATYALFERKGLEVPSQLRARASAALYSQNPDRALIEQSGGGTGLELFLVS
jgi:dynein light intermediate chain 2